MLIYLDICCLKRPFDDQSQLRVRLESDAVLALLAMEFHPASNIHFIRSHALTMENLRNSVKERASRVQDWIDANPPASVDTKRIRPSLENYLACGFKPFDALHLATAVLFGAEVLVTCDDRFLSLATHLAPKIPLRVMNILDAAKEFAT